MIADHHFRSLQNFVVVVANGLLLMLRENASQGHHSQQIDKHSGVYSVLKNSKEVFTWQVKLLPNLACT